MSSLTNTCLNNVANCFLARPKHLGELGDLEQAISRLREATDLIPDGHPDKLGLLKSLGNSFVIRLERIGGLSDPE